MDHALTSAFGLQDLARNQAASFRHDSLLLSIARPLAWPFVHIGAWGGERFALHFAQKFAQRAVWFRGAVAKVDSRPLDRVLDPADNLRRSLDEMESDLKEIAEGSLEIVIKLRRLDGKARGRLRDALVSMSECALELKAEVRNFKGSVQAHDANVEALVRAKRPMTTAAELDAHFDSCMG